MAQTDSSFAFLGRDIRRPVEPDEIYFLEATGEATLVRLRSARPGRDVRALGEICPILAAAGVLRIHRNHAVNVGRIAEIRRRDTDADWEVALEAPVNRVLPVARAHLKRLWAAFGEAWGGKEARGRRDPVKSAGGPEETRAARGPSGWSHPQCRPPRRFASTITPALVHVQ